MSPSALEWLGYAASAAVALSLLMSSIIKLRWFNLAGCALLAAYGAGIGSRPVWTLNLFLTAVNAWHLFRVYSEREYFRLIEIEKDSLYLAQFLRYHRREIARLFPRFDAEKRGAGEVGFFVLRNLVPAGLFVGSRRGDDLVIELDFVTPEFRDFKAARYLFVDQAERFEKLGFRRFVSPASDARHADYLRRMGFREETFEGRTALVREIAAESTAGAGA